MKRGKILWMALLVAEWTMLTGVQPLPAEEAKVLPPEIQDLQKKAAEARAEAQAVELEAARAQVKAAEADLAVTEALAKFTKALAEKDRKAKEWAKQSQKNLTTARQNLENARQRLDLILHPPLTEGTPASGLPQTQKPDQNPSEKPPRMEDIGNKGGQ